jgi:hypothetical protein
MGRSPPVSLLFSLGNNLHEVMLPEDREDCPRVASITKPKRKPRASLLVLIAFRHIVTALGVVS